MNQALIGLLTVLAIGYFFSENRRKVDFKRVGLALILQFFLAFFLLKVDFGREFFAKVGKIFASLKEAYDTGIAFVLGPEIYELSFRSLALTLIPMIIFISALSAVLFHYRILQVLINFFALVFRRVAGMSGPEAMGAAANIFMGMAEAPLLIAPYLKKLTRAQLFMIMVAGMATISGALMMVYADRLSILFGSGEAGLATASAHLLVASVISAPAAFLIARLLVPEEKESFEMVVIPPPTSTGFFDALATGTASGLRLTAYVVAMLIVIVATVKLVDIALIGVFGEGNDLSSLLGTLMAMPAWLLGIDARDCVMAGSLLGEKVILNEFIAYEHMLTMKFHDEKTVIIMSYALCGFANLGSIGIMIASMGGLCPERRGEIAALGFKAMWAGFMAICMTAMVVAIIL
jgi:CNT family concentrative nucleoside transporter